MTLILFIPAFILALASAFAEPRMVGETLDISAVRSVVISGEASEVRLTADDAGPYRANTSARRHGWFSSFYSSWFFNGCRDRSAMRIEGTVLKIEVMQTAWSDLSDCTAEISANVAPDTTVRIDQQALKAELDGDFANVAIASKAADITFDGHAAGVDILGTAVRAHLRYDTIRQDETLSITAQSLQADLTFGSGVPLDYSVIAKASYVDSLEPSVPGARPRVSIKGDYVHARIR
ncbi:hypothetical protein ATY81_24870 [Rhizobium sp. R72]|uniref:hypothetical protein n=1 Tax=unclassified Rhizobium TaxID=2613769 RepID=UPI000B534C40|nr:MULTISPECIES: hypothetical protein [unclassified Rhizobium]OWV83615.1 hypothetical protein ATY79_13460 [Rhizobium sp. R693]OWW00581.1 hypothetical protein ATY81_24870 [Rhizobium sp. R72]OWW00665.1 hypothetical protein ATY80_24870 [Rhizobium sp. R711]